MMKEVYPLRWPEGWPRTLLDDRDVRTAWKKNERDAIELLEIELERFDAVGVVLTRQDPHDIRLAPDPSVAVYFARRADDDFSWQTVLGITNPTPSLDQINSAFKKLATKFHPDVPGTGDRETYYALDQHKKNAIAYVNRMSGQAPSFAIACDKYKQARWNISAIKNTIHSLRQMERDGTSRLLDRAMEGFKAQLPENVSEATNVHATHS